MAAAQQLCAGRSAARRPENSTAGSGTGFTITGTGRPGPSSPGWRGQIAAFKTKAATTTTLSSSANPSVATQPVTFTATVSPNTVTGTVTFTQTSPTATLCTAVPLVLVSGQLQATCNTTYNSADASIPVTATYSGDGSNAGSSNSPLTQVVNKANTTASTPTSSYNPSPFGQSVTYSTTVTINAPGTGSLADGTGSVSFRDGGLPGSPIVCTVNLIASVATCTTTPSTAGTHLITAEFNGNGDFNDSPLSATLSQVVNAAPVAGAGCTLVVDGAGANTGAYLTIQQAVNVLPDPGPCTINVKAGTYKNQSASPASTAVSRPRRKRTGS